MGSYSHPYCTEFDCNFSDGDGHIVEAAEEFRELSRSAMNVIYAKLEKEYNYTNSDECVDENIEANEYGFTIEGKRSVVL